MGCCIIVSGGLWDPGPPCQLKGWLGLLGGTGLSPQHHCRKRNSSSCCQEHPSVSAWGRARSLSGPCVLLPEECGQPQSLP